MSPFPLQTPPRPARDHRRAERRTQLLDAAVGAIRSHGPAVTMEQIASAGGVTKPILYRHFGDRDGLVNAVVERFAADLLGPAPAPLVADASPHALLRSTVDAYIGFIERETHLYRFMVQHPTGPSGRASGMRSLVDRIAHQIAVVAATRLRRAGHDATAALPCAYGIVGLIHQAGDWWVDDRSVPRAALVEHLVALLWHGVGPSPAAEDCEA